MIGLLFTERYNVSLTNLTQQGKLLNLVELVRLGLMNAQEVSWAYRVFDAKRISTEQLKSNEAFQFMLANNMNSVQHAMQEVKLRSDRYVEENLESTSIVFIASISVIFCCIFVQVCLILWQLYRNSVKLTSILMFMTMFKVTSYEYM
jgi:hypothetical protein